MNSHYSRLVLKVAEVQFLPLCAPRCPFCAVFVPPQCNAHLPLYCTVLSETGSLTLSCVRTPRGSLGVPTVCMHLCEVYIFSIEMFIESQHVQICCICTFSRLYIIIYYLK